MRKLASIQRVWKIEPIDSKIVSGSLSMKVVSNKYLLKNKSE